MKPAAVFIVTCPLCKDAHTGTRVALTEWVGAHFAKRHPHAGAIPVKVVPR